MSAALVDYDLVVQVLGDVEKVRLMSAVGLVILLYDHVLSLPDEVELVWSARFTSSKILFLALRYCVPIVMILNTVELAGFSNLTLSDNFCKAWYILGMLMGWLTLAINDWLVLLRLWILWDRSRTLIISTLFIFIASNTTIVVLTISPLPSVIPKMMFNPFVQICATATPFAPAHFRVLWMPEVLFQFMMLCALGWKILMHPQTFNALLRDGYLYFFCLFALNLINQTIMLVVRPSLVFLTVFFVWCFTTTATCRMILGLRRSSYRAREPSEGSGTAHLELSERRQSSSTTRDVETPTRKQLIDTRFRQ